MIRKITIDIERLGPIQGPFRICLHPFMMFSGASNLGKSYLAMLVHYVYKVLCGEEVIRFFIEKDADYDTLKERLSEESQLIYEFQIEEFEQWVNMQAIAYLRKTLGHAELNAQFQIHFPHLPEKMIFLYSRNVMSVNDGAEMEYVDVLRLKDTEHVVQLPRADFGGWRSIPFSYLFVRYMRGAYDFLLDKTFFLPPSRGSILSMPNSLTYQLRGTKDDKMGMYWEFLDDLSDLMTANTLSQPSNVIHEAADLMHKEVLKGDVEIVDNNWQYRQEERSIPMSAAASSIRELAPFALMINKGIVGRYSILFEEPESHLHPELQVGVADLLAYVIQEGAHCQITTHSDYLLRRINDLIRLAVLKMHMPTEEYEAYCEQLGMNPELVIEPDRVGAYYLSMGPDGLSRVEKQDATKGVPFDTFTKVLNEQLGRSARLYEEVEYLDETEDGVKI